MGRKPVHLVFVEEKNKGDGVDHNKFYDMFERNGECHCLWGRRQDGYEFGKSGKLTVKPLYEWDSIYSSKIAKGYEDKSYLYEELLTTQPIGGSGKDDLYAPIPNPKIAEIVERLQRYAKEVISANYSVKSGQVTKVMVDETQRYIDQLVFCLNPLNITKFNYLLNEIFKIISRSMSRVENYLVCDKNPEWEEYLKDPEKYLKKVIQREQDLLDVMRGQIITPVKGQKVVTQSGDKHTILELNGITMEEVGAKDIEEIKKRMGNSANRFVNAWKVTNEKQEKAYNAYCKEEGLRKRDCKLLWHGTRSENVWNILKTGLVLRPNNAIITGKMLGMGLYFAPDFLKSRNYTSAQGTTWAKGRDNTGFMILHAVAYGNPYNLTKFGQISQSFSYRDLRNLRDANGNKYNCVHAHKGMDTGWSSLRADEIVVYKEEQVMPLYLVEVT